VSKQQTFTIKHFVVLDGVKTEIDPCKHGDIADRCKLAIANVYSNGQYTLAKATR